MDPAPTQGRRSVDRARQHHCQQQHARRLAHRPAAGRPGDREFQSRRCQAMGRCSGGRHRHQRAVQRRRRQARRVPRRPLCGRAGAVVWQQGAGVLPGACRHPGDLHGSAIVGGRHVPPRAARRGPQHASHDDGGAALGDQCRSALARDGALREESRRAQARSCAVPASYAATSLRIVFSLRRRRHAKVIFTLYGGVLSHRRGVSAAQLTGFHAALRSVPYAPVRSRRGHCRMLACSAGANRRRVIRRRGSCVTNTPGHGVIQ
ncbi:hypothetical protein XFF6166_320026 [Xanthomonas citri pv. fuscans]|nr:hypothetical protein XFF6166_320026 [Xanthomonas citri pv. fuscans]SOO02855.1 hypothetical protein XFF6960_710002 [Xanthomonas citri pv. fuscans]SOO05527.1 hypothetical protein XFF7767_440002 [Xanthomonas citri pv. fuscans]SOO08731.1 hypothetical protein XFF6970_270054 [Xanthomonas citri pv. fuscans]SOO16781.1 hypothetical protein XFF7766_870002 [Xanthomonas citri pv. fuscans]